MDYIKNFIKQKKCTLLCVGPMSKNCIDASIDISKNYDVPIILIASRRQIDSDIFGGGYVENFTTQNFSDYVRSQNADKIFLARDHGGPWQHPLESKNNIDEISAMESAKKSFEADIKSGFDLVHIDTSVSRKGENLDSEKALNRLFELYSFCHETANKNNKNINFELGTEEQSGYGQDLKKLEYFLKEIIKFCDKNKIKKPLFVVAQTGTKVKETQNIGMPENASEKDKESHTKNLLKILKIFSKYDIMLKEHNTDYLGDEILSLRPLIGIHASNVAPEFGVSETKALLEILDNYGYTNEREQFIEIANNSKKWEKWMLPNTKATKTDKALICGHYIFSNPEIIEMKNRISFDLKRKNLNLDENLKKAVKKSIMRYMNIFNILK